MTTSAPKNNATHNSMPTTPSIHTCSPTKKRKVENIVATHVYTWLWRVLRLPLASSHSMVRSPAQVRCHRSQPTQPQKQASSQRQSSHSGSVWQLSTDEQEQLDQQRLRTMQAKCLNCRQVFFCVHGTSASSSSSITFCCLDCRTSYEYRAMMQQAIDRQHYVQYHDQTDEEEQENSSDYGYYCKPSISSTKASTCPIEKDVDL